jgi:tetratricopeptide (TPR) repeat protein
VSCEGVMADETETEGAAPQPEAARAAGGAAWSSLGAASQAEADAFLREQTRLAREQARLTELQSQSLTDQNSYELSHLRWRRFNDQMKGALQIMTVAMGALVVVMIVAAMWNASRAAGLVVETFSVPPAYAAAGVSGAVLADDLTNAVGTIRDKADATSLVRSDDVRQERDDEIRVEIPETGVSIAQAWRYLRRWLGHERRLAGNLRSGDGTIALTVALDGERAFTLSGGSGDLAKLEQQAAERVFESVDPNNYIIYLLTSGRAQDCLAAAARYAQRPGSPTARAYSLALWAGMTRSAGGDLNLSMARARLAAAIDPKLLTAHWEMMTTASSLAHDEEALREAKLIPTLDIRHQPRILQGGSSAQIAVMAAIQRETSTGDFGKVAAPACATCFSPPLLPAEMAARLHDAARSRTLIAEALASGPAPADVVGRARYFAGAAAADWPAAAADGRAYGAPLQVGVQVTGPTTLQAAPLLAYALARAGDFAGADAAIEATPLDCYGCLQARGEVAALKSDWSGADAWFARAVAAAPSIPFAYADRGEMLLRKGDADAAIAQFALAHQRGPHFADPLELWGEALMAKSRPDLALAKFEEAARYAPNWGRLHLKWAEALLALHQPDAARRQLALAAALALAPDEASELSRLRAQHGWAV